MIIQNNTFTNTETGEVFDGKPKQFDIFPDDKYLFWAKKHFRKSYQDIKLSDIVGTGEDFHKIHLLFEYLHNDTNTLMVRVSRNKIRIADIEDVSNIIGLNVRHTKEFINRMICKHVIAENISRVGDNVITKYVVNPLFQNTSKHLTADLYFLFEESLNNYLPKWVVQKFHEIGNIKSESKKGE